MIATTAVMGFLHALQSGIDYIHQFDDAVVDLTKVVDLSRQQIDYMKQSAIDLGKELGKSSVEIMKGMAEWGRFAKNVEDIKQLTKVSTMASNVSDLSVQDASKAMTTAMIAYKMEVKDMMPLLDSFNEIQNNMRVSVKDIADAIGVMGNAAAQAKVPMSTLEGYISAIVQSTGMAGSEVGTALKSAISRVYRLGPEGAEDAGKAEEQLKTIGVAVRDTSGNFRAFSSIINDVQSKWSGLNNVQQMAIAQAISGTLHYSKILGLFNNFSLATQATTLALNSQGSAVRENAKYVDSITGRMEKFKATWENFANSVISSDVFKGLISGTTSLVDKFGNLQTIILSLITGFALWKGTVATAFVVDTIKSSVNSFANLALNVTTATTATQGFTVAWNALKTAFVSNPIGILATAITAVVVAIDIFNQKQEEAARKAEEIKQKYDQEISTLKDLRQQYIDIIKSGDQTSESKLKLNSIQEQLIKNYKAEKDSIDLVNGKYKDQINIIDNLNATKNKEYIREIGSTALESKKALFGLNTTNFRVFDFNSKDLEDIQKKYQKQMNTINSQGSLGNPYSDVMITGTLETRVKILGELSDKLKALAENDSQYQDAYAKISSEWTKLNDSLKANTDTWTKYSEANFYDKFKENISEVHDLQMQLFKTEDTNEQSEIEKKLDKIKEKITTNKAFISDFKPFVEELFNIKPKDTITQATNIEVKSFEELAKSVKQTVNDIKDLNDIQDDLAKGNKLTADSMIDLVTKYPELLNYIHKTADGYTIEAEGLEIVKKAYIDKEATTLQTEAGITDVIYQQLKSRLEAYGIEIEAIQNLNDARSAAYTILDSGVPDYVKSNSSYQQYANQTRQQLDSIAKVNALKGMLESGLKRSTSKESSSGGGGTQQEVDTPEKLIEKDYLASITQRIKLKQSEIDLNKALQDTSPEKDKIALMEKQIKLQEQQQDLYHEEADIYRKRRNELEQQLKPLGVNFAGTGDERNATNAIELLQQKEDKINALIAKVNNASKSDKVALNKELAKEKENYSDLKSKLEAYFDIISTKLPEVRKQWSEYEKSIGDVSKATEELVKNSVKNLLDAQEKADKQALKLKKQETDKNVEQTNKNLFYVSQDEYEKYHNDRIDMLKKEGATQAAIDIETSLTYDKIKDFKQIYEDIHSTKVKDLQIQVDSFEKSKEILTEEEKLASIKDLRLKLVDYNLNKLQDQRITKFDDELNQLEKINNVEQERIERLQKQIDLELQRQTVQNIQNEKNTYVYHEGQGFIWEADQKKLREENQKLADMELDYIKWNREKDDEHTKAKLQSEIDADNKLTQARKDAFDQQKSILENAYNEQNDIIEQKWSAGIEDITQQKFNELKNIYKNNLGEIYSIVVNQTDMINKQLSSISSFGDLSIYGLTNNVSKTSSSSLVNSNTAVSQLKTRNGVTYDPNTDYQAIINANPTMPSDVKDALLKQRQAKIDDMNEIAKSTSTLKTSIDSAIGNSNFANKIFNNVDSFLANPFKITTPTISPNINNNTNNNKSSSINITNLNVKANNADELISTLNTLTRVK